MHIYLLTLCSFIPSVLLFETEVGYLFYFDSLVICINLSCSVSDFISLLSGGWLICSRKSNPEPFHGTVDKPIQDCLVNPQSESQP